MSKPLNRLAERICPRLRTLVGSFARHLLLPAGRVDGWMVACGLAADPAMLSAVTACLLYVGG